PVRTTSKEELLVETFYREHIEKNPFERLPAYPYEKLNKGIFCLNCQEQLNREGRYHVRCTKCSYREWIDSAILRNIVEFNILFPKEKMNKSKMGEWCGDIASPKTIRRVSNKDIIRKGEG